jgi:hypothetical protein
MKLEEKNEMVIDKTNQQKYHLYWQSSDLFSFYYDSTKKTLERRLSILLT